MYTCTSEQPIVLNCLLCYRGISEQQPLALNCLLCSHGFSGEQPLAAVSSGCVTLHQIICSKPSPSLQIIFSVQNNLHCANFHRSKLSAQCKSLPCRIIFTRPSKIIPGFSADISYVYIYTYHLLAFRHCVRKKGTAR